VHGAVIPGAALGCHALACARRVLATIQGWDSLTAITIGCYVGTLAPFVLVASSAEMASVVFVVVLAFGEALWAPRFYTCELTQPARLVYVRRFMYD